MINEYWRSGGDSQVMKSFIRLTPDRQSKRGYLWSKQPIHNENISTTIKFRISGQGKTFFGDGIALWFTDAPHIVDHGGDGNLHGGPHNFRGIGIIFDTFKNTENLAQHRDVSVLINTDGHRHREEMIHTSPGCNTNPTARYHNVRDDFDVTESMSRATIVLHPDMLTIKVDARNTGEWQDCVEVPLEGMDPSWLARSFMGISASTGSLADNHDIISIQTDSDPARGMSLMTHEKQIIDNGADKLPQARLYTAMPNGAVEPRLQKIENTLNDILIRLQKMDQEMEHADVDAEEKIKNIVGKLAQRETESERRIEVIESIVREQVEHHVSTHVEDRLADHELSIKEDLQHTVNDIADHIDKQVDSMEEHKNTLSASIDEVAQFAGKAGGGGWQMPFYFLLALVIVSLGAGYYYFEQFKKKHYL